MSYLLFTASKLSLSTCLALSIISVNRLTKADLKAESFFNFGFASTASSKLSLTCCISASTASLFYLVEGLWFGVQAEKTNSKIKYFIPQT
jgi:hypothetical protein